MISKGSPCNDSPGSAENGFLIQSAEIVEYTQIPISPQRAFESQADDDNVTTITASTVYLPNKDLSFSKPSSNFKSSTFYSSYKV